MSLLCLCIDSGTTNTRVRLLEDRTLIASATRPVGVRDVAIAQSNACLKRAIHDCIQEILPPRQVVPAGIDLVCASGMLTSNVGLCDLPHLRAPVALDDLARGVVCRTYQEILPVPLHLIPGVRSGGPAVFSGPTAPLASLAADPDQGLGCWDMMRGEETETFGILGDSDGPVVLLLPGSHTKAVRLDAQGRIQSSYTTVAGEVMQAMAQQTVLASSVSWPPPPPPLRDAVLAGARFALNQGLLRGGFCVRLAQVLGQASLAECSWFLVGLVVGADLDQLTRWRDWSGCAIRVSGRRDLKEVYSYVLKDGLGVNVTAVDDGDAELASALGGIRIVRRYRQLT